jgi:hypothetical protein
MLILPIVVADDAYGTYFRQVWLGDHYAIYLAEQFPAGAAVVVARHTGRSAGSFPDFATALDFIELEPWEDASEGGQS